MGFFVSSEDNVKIFFQREGDSRKPVLLLSHGYGSDIGSYDDLVPHLLQNFEIIRWDHRGHGNSDKPKDEKTHSVSLYSMKKLANDLFSLIQHLDNFQGRPLYLYGHSMGGMVAQQFAVLYPKVLTGLALGSTSPSNNTNEMHAMLDDYITGKVPLNEESFRESVHKGYRPDYLKSHPEIIETSIARKKAVGAIILKALAINFVKHYNVEMDLPKIQTPTIILHGSQDKTIPVTSGERIHVLIPHSSLVVFPALSHGINKEIPDQVAATLIDFFL